MPNTSKTIAQANAGIYREKALSHRQKSCPRRFCMALRYFILTQRYFGWIIFLLQKIPVKHIYFQDYIQEINVLQNSCIIYLYFFFLANLNSLDTTFAEPTCYLFFTAQKMKFFIEDLFSKCDQIHRKLRIWSHLLSFFVQCLLIKIYG